MNKFITGSLEDKQELAYIVVHYSLTGDGGNGLRAHAPDAPVSASTRLQSTVVGKPFLRLAAPPFRPHVLALLSQGSGVLRTARHPPWWGA